MRFCLDRNLKNKVVVVAGANSPICQEIAISLAEAGAKVAMVDSSFSKIDNISKVIQEKGYNAKFYFADMLSKKSVEATHKLIVEDFGKCDILVNGFDFSDNDARTDKEYYIDRNLKNDCFTFFDVSVEKMTNIFDLNFKVTIISCQEFAKDMVDGRGGNIVNISSACSTLPYTKVPSYSASKASLENFTKWLAVYFSKSNIRVNSIAPGFLLTKQNEKIFYNEYGTPSARCSKILQATPMERFGKISELFGPLMFLINDEMASFITGTCISVDGGFSAYSGV